MTAPLRFVLLLILLCLLAVGCSRQQAAQSDAPTPSAHLPARQLSDPLTEQEVRLFLEVLETLPDQQAPEFEPLSQVTADERFSAARLTEVYRQEYREMFDASRHGARWRNDETLMATFAQHDVTPEDFAALMIRMSCAIAASAISPEVDLQQVSDNADAQVARLVEDINRLDAAPRTTQSVDYRRQALESLQNFVAFSEFTKILREVPAASREVVARHRSQLAGHLPQTGTVEQFERTIESKVVPTSFEQRQTLPPGR